ncbi:protein boule-like isoform X2 [Nelusetta ayraudi]|uniref:protein boule-like isoform X2 n=1 Tax=Nelusetta ayraudi TaxID=303726 RepID=UPI003F6F18D7
MEASNQIVSCSMSAPHEVSPDCKSIPTRYTSRFSLVPNRVFVCGIDYETKGDELLHIFSHYGAVKDVRIVLDRFGMSKGYGFVTFQNQEDALKVLCDSNGVTLKHRRLCVSQAYRKQKRRRHAHSHGRVVPLPREYTAYPAGYPLNYHCWSNPSQPHHLVPVSHISPPVMFPQPVHQHFALYQYQSPAEYSQPSVSPDNAQKECREWPGRRQ